jgi:cytochrome c biogenesis protein CcmG, thiol:disulfide interchange protein DsbE
MSRLWRWLIPLATIPVLGLLAYGFRVDPRAVPSPLIGRLATPFTLVTLEGMSLSLESARGKVVVLNFWASWCYPACYDEAPLLERSWQAYRDRGLALIGVDIQDRPEAGTNSAGVPTTEAVGVHEGGLPDTRATRVPQPSHRP